MSVNENVMLSRATFDLMSMRIASLRASNEQLRSDVREVTGLLVSATRDLGAATGARDLEAFTRKWISQHRQPDLEGVPFTFGSGA